METLDRSKLSDEQMFATNPRLSGNTVAEVGLCSFWQFLGHKLAHYQPGPSQAAVVCQLDPG